MLAGLMMMVAVGLAWDGHIRWNGAGQYNHQETIPNLRAGIYEAKAACDGGGGTSATSEIDVGGSQILTAQAWPGEPQCLRQTLQPVTFPGTWNADAVVTQTNGWAECWGRDPNSQQAGLCPTGGEDQPGGD